MNKLLCLTKRSLDFSSLNSLYTSNKSSENKKLKTSTDSVRRQVEKVLKNHLDSKNQLTRTV